MKRLIVLNHKTNFNRENCVYYINEIKDKIPIDKDIVICPNMTLLPYFCGKYDFQLGAQNAMVSNKNITGEVSFEQLKFFNVKYAIIGHSERQIFNETNLLLNEKIKDAIKYGITPIICVGETLMDRKLNRTSQILIKRIKECLTDVNFNNGLVIAYEPIWAIGTGKTPSVRDVYEAVTFIKNVIYKNFNKNIRVIYGGSITSKNVLEYSRIKELDGFLIGASSIKEKEILNIFDNI